MFAEERREMPPSQLQHSTQHVIDNEAVLWMFLEKVTLNKNSSILLFYVSGCGVHTHTGRYSTWRNCQGYKTFQDTLHLTTDQMVCFPFYSFFSNEKVL